MEYIILLVLGVIAIILSLILSFSIKGENKKIMNKSHGTITMINSSDGGNVWYYINVNLENGKNLEGQSIHYSNTNKKYYIGDIVPVKYYYTKKNNIQLELDDPDLKPCKNSLKNTPKILLIIGISLIMLFILFSMKSFI